jgi:1,4-alpha-glucan branching enzyme
MRYAPTKLQAAMKSVVTSKSAPKSGRTPTQPANMMIHFEFTDPVARKVCLAGSFNDWRPDEIEMVPLGGGKWAKDLNLAPGAYEYRLIVDGKWMLDPNASRTVPNPFGESNSLLTVPPPGMQPRPGRRISA